MKKIFSLTFCLILMLNMSIVIADSNDIITEEKFQKILEENKQRVDENFQNSILGNNGSMIGTRSIPGDSGNPASVNSSTTFTTMGVMDYGTTLSGNGPFAKASGSLLGKCLYLRADAEPLWSDASAWGYIGKDFVYTGTVDKAAYITLQGSYRTTLITSLNTQYSANAAANVQISVEIWDKTLGSRIASRTILSESAGFLDYKAFANSYNEGISLTLKPYHRYVAIIRAEGHASSRVTGTGRMYANPDDNGYVKISQIKITF